MKLISLACHTSIKRSVHHYSIIIWFE